MDNTATLGECILWQGGLTKDGYGSTTIGEPGHRKSALAHRVIYAQTYGPIPEGLCVRHKCDNRPCVNPEHLELGTNADNVRDRMERGRDGHLKNTHCPSGHEFSESNTRINKEGARICKTCARIACKKWRDKQKRGD